MNSFSSKKNKQKSINESLSSVGDSADSQYLWSRDPQIAQSQAQKESSQLENENLKNIPDTTRPPHSDSCLSETSAMIQMTQKIKQKILRNHIMLILVLNLLQIFAMMFTISWPPWYYGSDTEGDEQMDYGLLLSQKNGSVSLNGFRNENNKEVGGISSFILFILGILIQLLYLFQLLAFFKSYPASRGFKFIKFKTCRWICLFLYSGAVGYWIIVVFLVQIVKYPSNFSQLGYGFWIANGCIGSFLLISLYFNILKRKIRKNDLVSNLLNANHYLRMDDKNMPYN